MAKRREKQVRNLVVVSDLHVGCRLALCHPDGAALDDGGTYMPSPIQRKIWSMWEQFWNEWVPRATHGEPFTVVVNGDAIDGSHHGSTTQWSQNLEDQGEHCVKIVAPIRDACEGRLYWVRGTEAHVGKSGVEEERIAKRLGAVPNEQGQHARYELWKRVGESDTVHCLHHIGVTSSSAHETSALNSELSALFVEAGRWGHPPPQVVVRSHRHRSSEVRLPARWGYATCVVTPAWQLRTPFAFKVAGARVTTPQIGGILIRAGDEELHTRLCVWDIGRTPVE
jgi:hypothetical protein